MYSDDSHPATVSDFRLDKYEITVGRFRQFVAAILAGWRPAAGSGKHVHLNGGMGLNGTAGGYEPGWNAASWNGLFLTKAADWNSNLAMAHGTWTASPGAHENEPISNVTWYDAYAFCIWDGGFLPSEAEWNYAAAGGGGISGQRVFPWSIPSTNQAIDCSYANYAAEQPGNATTGCTTAFCIGGCAADAPLGVGSKSPKGDGAFGQADLAGNIQEWVFDHTGTYADPCEDCANFTADSPRQWRGGGWSADATRDGNLVISYRYHFASSSRYNDMGARCARTP
jgi:formylglycine-generating enzyme required for sulfatase activity